MKKKEKKCVKAETKTYKYKSRSPTHQLICVRCQFSVSVFAYFPVLVLKSRRQTNGIFSLSFLNAIQIVDLKCEMCDRKYLFGDKLHMVQARMVKTCPKKVNKKKYFLYITQGSITHLLM